MPPTRRQIARNQFLLFQSMTSDSNDLNFSAEDFMPDWAKDKNAGGGGKPKTYKERPGDDKRSPKGGRRGQGGRFGQNDRDSRRGDDRRGGRGGEGRRHDSGPRGQRRHGDRRQRDDRPRPPRPAAGVKSKIVPSAATVQELASVIRDTGRSFSLYDLAKSILAQRERYDLAFACEGKAQLFSCPIDGSVWITKDEALTHALRSPEVVEKFYEVEKVKTDPPSGNFPSVAVCGFSGTLLGPPNHHSYAETVAEIHASRFANMSIERYKARIQMERDEEVIARWKEEASEVTQYRVREDQPEASTDSVPALAAAVQQAAPAVGPEESADTEADSGDSGVTPAQEKKGEVLKSYGEMAAHLRRKHAEELVQSVSSAQVSGGIDKAKLSGGLFAHLLAEKDSLRKGFPLALIRELCNALEKESLRLFKRGKKALYVGAARPRAVTDNGSFSEQIQKIVLLIEKSPKTTVKDVMSAIAPSPEASSEENEKSGTESSVSDAEEAELSEAEMSVIRDIRWLTQSGFLIEYQDTKLELAKQRQEKPKSAIGAKPTKKKAKKPSSTASKSSETKHGQESQVSGEYDSFPLSGEGEESPFELPSSVDPVDVL